MLMYVQRRDHGELSYYAHPQPQLEPPTDPDPVEVDTSPPAAPVTITMVQARITLRRAGLLDAVEAAVTRVGGEASDRWHYGTTVRRDDPLVGAFAGQLGMSEAEVDRLFAVAAGV